MKSKKDGPGTVYGLYHPITDELRYIGKTMNQLRDRLWQHVAAGRKGNHATHIAKEMGINVQTVRYRIKLIKEGKYIV